jgi:hypothetical protein
VFNRKYNIHQQLPRLDAMEALIGRQHNKELCHFKQQLCLWFIRIGSAYFRRVGSAESFAVGSAPTAACDTSGLVFFS